MILVFLCVLYGRWGWSFPKKHIPCCTGSLLWLSPFCYTHFTFQQKSAWTSWTSWSLHRYIFCFLRTWREGSYADRAGSWQDCFETTNDSPECSKNIMMMCWRLFFLTPWLVRDQQRKNALVIILSFDLTVWCWCQCLQAKLKQGDPHWKWKCESPAGDHVDER